MVIYYSCIIQFYFTLLQYNFTKKTKKKHEKKAK